MTEKSMKNDDLENDRDILEDGPDLITRHPGSHPMDDRPGATRWLIKLHGKSMTAVKVKRDAMKGVYISEVALLSKHFHLPGGKFKLSMSYTPYINVQWYALFDENVEAVHVSVDAQLYFFEPGGVELVTHKSDVAVHIPALKKASMSAQLTDGLAMYLKEDGTETDDSGVAMYKPMLITGPAGVGKSTLIKKLRDQGHTAIDGDTFGSAVDNVMMHHMKVYYWVKSEMDELAFASTELERLDGVLDAMGALFAYAATMPSNLMNAAIDAYVKSQQERNRPEHFFYEMFDIIRNASDEDTQSMKGIYHSRYNGATSANPLTWTMDWNLDIDSIISVLESGTSVAVTGTNINELVELCIERDIPVVHLSAGIGTLKDRMTERLFGYHQSGLYPHGIKDLPWDEYYASIARGLQHASEHDIKVVFRLDGKFTLRDVLS